MTVQKEIERLEHSAVRLTLRVPKDDLRSEYDETIDNYAKSIQIKGFRKGKAPRGVLVRKFDEAFRAETLAHIIEHSVQEVFAAEDFPEADRPLAYSTPEMKDAPPELDLEQDLSFQVVYDVMPPVSVGPWKGLEVTVRDARIGDEDLDRELEAIRERNAVVLDRNDGEKAREGDVVTVNYAEIDESGAVVPGTEREDFAFTLGTGYNIYRFDDDIAGMEKGETKVFEKTWAGGHEDQELAGKTKKLRVSLTALKERQLPELDDDLAQDVDEKYQTLEDLKKDIRNRLEKSLDARRKELRVSAILEKILEKTAIDLPESMIRVELEGRWRALARQFNADPAQLADLMNRGEKSQAAFLEEWRPDAERALRSRLVLETLVREQGLDASEEEVEEEYGRIALDSNTGLDEVKQYYSQGNMKDYVVEEIRERKIRDILLTENTVKPGETVNYLDLMANNG